MSGTVSRSSNGATDNRGRVNVFDPDNALVMSDGKIYLVRGLDILRTYEFQELLGKGSNGSIYRYGCTPSSHSIAVKVIHHTDPEVDIVAAVENQGFSESMIGICKVLIHELCNADTFHNK